MNDCVFCNIANKTLNQDILFENERLMVLRDILPKAPVHLLIVPKDHIPSINHIADGYQPLVGEMIYVAKDMATKQGIGESGYRLVINVGQDGGQVIPHLHLHLLGGKKLKESETGL